MVKQESLRGLLQNFVPIDVEGIEPLIELALDLRWSWNHCADDVWKALDPELWDLTKNPWVMIKTVSPTKLRRALADPDFRKNVEHLVEEKRAEAECPLWFQKTHDKSPLGCVAYFSMEYMLSEALPIYSGGLGNVAGDQLKAASDLGIPVIGVGLLYQKGYFRQVIDQYGMQEALYPFNDPGQLPILPVRSPNGEWLRIETMFPGYSVWLRTWQVQIGRVKLYLLDSNDAANFPAHRGITSELYGGGPEQRLRQELVLGIGGWRMLEALGIKPDVCHLNEGHAAFAVLERARSFMRNTGLHFEAALAATRAGNLFTTHTAVPAGFDRFSPALIEQYLETYARNKLGITPKELMALGRQNPKDDNEPFNMAYLAVRGSHAINGVSRLHAAVSRRIFQPIFPNWPENEVPVGYVTNGIHVPTWNSASADSLWANACGKSRWLGNTDVLEKNIRTVPDERLWKMRNESRAKLVDFSRRRLARQLAVRAAPKAEIEHARHIFDPNTLTLGFARRFATYKRPNLLLHDPERLLRILCNSERPVQLILAGKAHPADGPGQALIKQWMDFLQRPEARAHIIFLSDYDMMLTQELVQGVDVWLNTPRRPWEACGTSGMKVLANGGLNISELDGWWAEAYCSEVGWAIGDGQEHGEDPHWDDIDALKLYELLEHEVVPEFYNRDSKGIPRAWLTRMRESMARLTPQYSANRSVREYTEKYYLPGAAAFKERTANKGTWGDQVIAWQKDLNSQWPALSFGEVKVDSSENRHAFEVQLHLNGLDGKFVTVELYADGKDGAEPIHKEMKRDAGNSKIGIYRVVVDGQRPPTDYTPRVVARFPGIEVPLEAAEILWQH